jgi:enoyl-CoA hydratase
LTHIHERIADGVMLLELDHPPANAMNLAVIAELGETLERVAADPPGAVVLAGRGRMFSAGVDLKAIPEYGPEDQRRAVQGINRMVIDAYALPCPVVAAVGGHAIAGGLVLALAADMRIASSAGRYGLTEVRVAVPYPQAALMLVRAELTAGAARRLVLGAELIDADACLALGVVDEVVAPDDVLARATVRAQEFAALPAAVYARTKRDLRATALAEMRAAAARDPLLEAWTDADASA